MTVKPLQMQLLRFQRLIHKKGKVSILDSKEKLISIKKSAEKFEETVNQMNPSFEKEQQSELMMVLES